MTATDAIFDSSYWMGRYSGQDVCADKSDTAVVGDDDDNGSGALRRASVVFPRLCRSPLNDAAKGVDEQVRGAPDPVERANDNCPQEADGQAQNGASCEPTTPEAESSGPVELLGEASEDELPTLPSSVEEMPPTPVVAAQQEEDAANSAGDAAGHVSLAEADGDGQDKGKGKMRAGDFAMVSSSRRPLDAGCRSALGDMSRDVLRPQFHLPSRSLTSLPPFHPPLYHAPPFLRSLSRPPHLTSPPPLPHPSHLASSSLSSARPSLRTYHSHPTSTTATMPRRGCLPFFFCFPSARQIKLDDSDEEGCESDNEDSRDGQHVEGSEARESPNSTPTSDASAARPPQADVKRPIESWRGQLASVLQLKWQATVGEDELKSPAASSPSSEQQDTSSTSSASLNPKAAAFVPSSVHQRANGTPEPKPTGLNPTAAPFVPASIRQQADDGARASSTTVCPMNMPAMPRFDWQRNGLGMSSNGPRLDQSDDASPPMPVPVPVPVQMAEPYIMPGEDDIPAVDSGVPCSSVRLYRPEPQYALPHPDDLRRAEVFTPGPYFDQHAHAQHAPQHPAHDYGANGADVQRDSYGPVGGWPASLRGLLFDVVPGAIGRGTESIYDLPPH